MKDQLGNTVWDHEIKHIDIYEKWWNKGKEIVDPMEGSYCSEKCAKIAKNIVNLTMGVNIWSASLENAEFDNSVYGRISDRPGRIIENSNTKISEYQERLNKQNDAFNEAGCTKTW